MEKECVTVYAADTRSLQDERVFAEGYRRASAVRREKIDRYLFRKDKLLSLGAELLLQHCLWEHGIRQYQIAYQEYGKPYLQNCVYRENFCDAGVPLFFNLSHAGERVMCAIADGEIGCDVEKVTEPDLEIARRFYAPEEYEQIEKAQTEKAQRDLFFRFWTLKESYMKATGLGMAMAPESFRVDERREPDTYHFREYDLQDGYQYAVCARTEHFADRIEFVDLSACTSYAVPKSMTDL